MSSLLAASALGGLLALDNRGSLRFMISQPICGGLLTGLVLGAPYEGFMAGALFQMMFLGCVFVRGERIPDMPVGGVTAAALYVLVNRKLGGDPAVHGAILFWSLLLGIAVSWLGVFVYRLWRRWSVRFYDSAAGFAADGRPGRASAIHMSAVLFHFLYPFLVIAAVLALGRSLICFIVIKAGSASGGSISLLYVLVPFIGLGSLVRLHFIRTRVFWFGAGFLVSYVFLLARG